MDSEMNILFENGQKYFEFSRRKHADTVELIRAAKMGFFTERYSTVLCSSK